MKRRLVKYFKLKKYRRRKIIILSGGRRWGMTYLSESANISKSAWDNLKLLKRAHW